MTRQQPGRAPDAAEILASIGDVTYECEWRLDSDELVWSANAAAVLGVADIGELATGRRFAQRVDAEPGRSRADAGLGEPATPGGGDGVPYQVAYALRSGGTDRIWLEDTGRWFAGPDGKPIHGIVRVINERHERERQLTQLARFDPLTGEMNRASLTDTLTATLDDCVRFRGSCGFLLIAIDHLGHLNEAYGFDVTEDVIAKVAKRIRARLRGKDHMGRLSGNKFGGILTQCTTEELTVAAERLLAGVRDEPVAIVAGPVAVTVTIGGVNAPRHARTVPEILSRAQDALRAAPAPSGMARSTPTSRTWSATRCAAKACAPPMKSSLRSTNGA